MPALKRSIHKLISVDEGEGSIDFSPLDWWRGWGPVVVLPCTVLALFPAAWPRWAFMWTLALVIYAGCKWLTWRRTPVPTAPLWKHAGYLFAWPGMDAAAFLATPPSASVSPPRRAEWCFALAKFAGGILLVWSVARLVPRAYMQLAGWVGMIGIVMTLHFGLFHLLLCAWRTIGVDARPLMNWPLASRNIGQFWGVRWNTAFRDLTYRFLFRPLLPRLGAPGALLLGFLVSGLIHDLVISVPAGGGYGGPTLYFFVQGCAILVSRPARSRRVDLHSGFMGWAFAILALAVLLPLLFHAAFVCRVVVPFLEFIGAIR